MPVSMFFGFHVGGVGAVGVGGVGMATAIGTAATAIGSATPIAVAESVGVVQVGAVGRFVVSFGDMPMVTVTAPG